MRESSVESSYSTELAAITVINTTIDETFNITAMLQ